MNVQCSGGSRSFAKETRTSKMRSLVDDHWKLTVTNWEQSSVLILLKLTWEVAEELSVDHSTVISHLKQIGEVKKLDKWVPHELTENKRNHRFEVSSSLILCNNAPFLNRIVTCAKWILYDNQQWPAQWLDWEEAPKHFPKPNLHQEKVMVTGGLLPIWSTTAFWILVKPLHLKSMLSNLMRCTENCNAYRWH